jgi:hypothetical protein
LGAGATGGKSLAKSLIVSAAKIIDGKVTDFLQDKIGKAILAPHLS